MTSWTIDPPSPRARRAPPPKHVDGDARTSASHPITVSWVLGDEIACEQATPGGVGGVDLPGRLGLCYCPGKNLVRDGITWRRNVVEDATRLRSHHGVNTVVCLVSDRELRALGVEPRCYADALARAGMEAIRYEVDEMAAPPSVDCAMDLLDDVVCCLLRRGDRVVFHCRGGVGRAGTLAACARLLAGRERTAADAIAAVRKRRCRTAVESRRQEAFVAEFASAIEAAGGG